MNILQLIGAIKSGNSIQGLMSMIPPNVQNNPMAQNVMNMAQNNDTAGLENFARNLGKEKGINVDQAYNQIAQLFGNGPMGRR